MRRGTFILSLDVELMWGWRKELEQACAVERAHIIDQLLRLFVQFDVPATWFIVGHLFLDRCSALNGVKHPEILPPTAEWFNRDPCGDERTNPDLYGRTLVDKIRSCSVPQEIGCHSFSHVSFPECSREIARSEIAECSPRKETRD